MRPLHLFFALTVFTTVASAQNCPKFGSSITSFTIKQEWLRDSNTGKWSRFCRILVSNANAGIQGVGVTIGAQRVTYSLHEPGTTKILALEPTGGSPRPSVGAGACRGFP